MSVIWTSDLCGCKSNYEVINGEVVGSIIESCDELIHDNFELILSDNKKKNISKNLIEEVIDMTGKEIGFQFENGIITLLLYNFTEEDKNIVNELNLDVNIIEG